MAWPASTQTLEKALANVNTQALAVKARLQQLVTDSAAGAVDRWRLVDVMRLLSQAIAMWNAASALPGMAAYAQAQVGNSQLDVATEFQSMVNAAQSLLNWIAANFPKDATSGAALVASLNADGTMTQLTFTTAQLATFRTNANAVIATIG